MPRIYLDMDMGLGFGMAQIANATYSKYAQVLDDGTIELPSIFWLENSRDQEYWEKLRNYHKDLEKNDLPKINFKFVKVEANESLDIIKAYLSLLRIKHLFSEIPPFEIFLQENVIADNLTKAQAKKLYKKLRAFLLVPSDVKITKLARSELVVIDGELYGRFGGKWYSIYPDNLPPTSIPKLLQLLKEYKETKPPTRLPDFLFEKLPQLISPQKLYSIYQAQDIDYSIPSIMTLKYHGATYTYHAFTPQDFPQLGIRYLLKTEDQNEPSLNTKEISISRIKVEELQPPSNPNQIEDLDLPKQIEQLEEGRIPIGIYTSTTVNQNSHKRTQLLYDPLTPALYLALPNPKFASPLADDEEPHKILLKIPTTNEIALYASESVSSQKLAVIFTLEVGYRVYSLTATTQNDLIIPLLKRELNPQEAELDLLEELGLSTV